jgi:hypothetical protein
MYLRPPSVDVPSNIKIGNPTNINAGAYNPTSNAHLTLTDRYGGVLLDGDIDILSFSTATYTQYDQDQVQRGLAWMPIRRSEMFIDFSIIWPFVSKKRLNAFEEMQSFQNIIRVHQQESVLTRGSPNPAVLYYYNNSNNQAPLVTNNLPHLGNMKNMLTDPDNLANNAYSSNLKSLVYQGWIDTSDKTYQRFQSYFVTSYHMNILNSTNDINFSSTLSSLGVGASNNITPNTVNNSSFSPTAINSNYVVGPVDINQITGTIN